MAYDGYSRGALVACLLAVWVRLTPNAFFKFTARISITESTSSTSRSQTLWFRSYHASADTSLPRGNPSSFRKQRVLIQILTCGGSFLTFVPYFCEDKLR